MFESLVSFEKKSFDLWLESNSSPHTCQFAALTTRPSGPKNFKKILKNIRKLETKNQRIIPRAHLISWPQNRSVQLRRRGHIRRIGSPDHLHGNGRRHANGRSVVLPRVQRIHTAGCIHRSRWSAHQSPGHRFSDPGERRPVHVSRFQRRRCCRILGPSLRQG